MSSESTEKDDSTAISENQSTDFKDLRTIDVDGHRPVDPSELHITRFIDIDGKRPVTSSDIEVHKMIQDDGNRPIASHEPQQTEITTDYMD